MKPFRHTAEVRNLLVAAGAYHLSWWVASPLDIAYGKLTQGIIYRGEFAGYVVMPLVGRMPVALVAAGVGASIIWLVESDRPARWVIIPAFLYALFGFLGHHWSRPPILLDRVAQAINALFPAITCAVAGILANRRRETSHTIQTTPG